MIMNTRVIKLTTDQIKYIYKVSMKVDFPDDERKPLAMILSAQKKGCYECLGLVSGEKILGYGFFYIKGDDCLLDYFAILSENRNLGYGSEFLKHIEGYFANIKNVLVEVEDPACAENQDEELIRTRRRDFYMRNGYEDTGAKVTLFGVDYNVLRMKNSVLCTREQAEEIYLNIYRDMLPSLLFNLKCFLRDK